MKPTADDAASVTPETAEVMQGLEDVRAVLYASRHHLIDRAIDRLIVLDANPKPAYCCAKCGLAETRHPREIALERDAQRGNFRHQQEDDGS